MFDTNQLQHLEVFSVQSAPLLGQATVSALMENCPALASLHSPANWGLELQELEDLRKKLVRENLGLDLGEGAAAGDREVSSSVILYMF